MASSQGSHAPGAASRFFEYDDVERLQQLLRSSQKRYNGMDMIEARYVHCVSAGLTETAPLVSLIRARALL